MDVPTHRMVDGQVVALTPEEVAEISAEWAAFESDPQVVFNQKVATGFDTGAGWFLPLDEASRAALSELRSQIVEGLDMGAWTLNDECPVSITAVDGTFHKMSIGDVRRLIFAAGNYYASLVSERRGGG